MSSRGYLVDAFYSIGEKTAKCSHLIEKIINCEDEEDLKNLQLRLEKTLLVRRKQMSYVLGKAEKPNPEEWCDFKHSLESFTHDREMYEATLDKEALEILKMSAEVLAMDISSVLGMDFEVCARCLNEKLLLKQYEEKQSAKIEAKGD